MQRCISCDTQLTLEEIICPYCNVRQISYIPAQRAHFEGLDLLEGRPAAKAEVQRQEVASKGVQPPSLLQRPAHSYRQNALIALLLCILVTTLCVMGYRVYYDTVSHPAQIRAQATATTVSATTTAVALMNSAATATVQANDPQYIYAQATAQGPAFSDGLKDESTSDWTATSYKDGSGCTFAQDGYRATEDAQKYFGPCYGRRVYGNFIFQVQMTITQGDAGVILFRANRINDAYYGLFIDHEGYYALYQFVDGTFAKAQALDRQYVQYVSKGYNQSNLISIVARDNVFSLFVNKHYVTDSVDLTRAYMQGLFALGAYDRTGTTNVVFTNAQVWEL